MRHSLVVLLGICSVAISLPCQASEYPLAQWQAWLEAGPHHWPAESWLKYAAPEEAGWSSPRLAKAREYYETINSAAVMVVYDGAVLAAWGDLQRRFMCHSVRKSLLSALYGIHVAEGTINLNKTLKELGIDDFPPLTEAEKSARVIDLLRSRSGIYHPAAYETAKMKATRPPRGSHAPGEVFWYNNWDFNTLCTIFEQETGNTVFEEFQRHFAVPLQMEDFRLQDTYYHLESQHSLHPAYPFRMSARDMARLGLLFLREGVWKDRVILTKQWIQESVRSHFTETDTTSNPQYGYGYLWWPVVAGPFRTLKMYSARGYGGHAIDILPVAGLVFVHRVDTFWDLSLAAGRTKRRVKDSERFKLLSLVLEARQGPPKPEPKLVALTAAKDDPPTVRLEKQQLGRLVGSYDFGDFRMGVELAGSRLVMRAPRAGMFSLLPCSETEFLVEDLEAPVHFELDAEGKPVRMVVEFVPGQQHPGLPEAPGP